MVGGISCPTSQSRTVVRNRSWYISGNPAITMIAVSHATITFLILFAVIVLFVWNRFAVEIVAIGALLALYAFGILPLDQIVAGFGDPTVVFIATLFVIGEGLDASGVTTWAGQQLSTRTGSDRTR